MIRELYINGQLIDLDESDPIESLVPITYSQADAKNPEKRKRTASKTIVAPGTQNNNRFFSSCYDLHLTSQDNNLIGFDYDPTLRYPAQVYENGEKIFDGASNLIKVVRKKGVNKFHIILFSEIVDLFQALGDRLVSELDWSAYDHTLSVANIQASWSATPGSGYVYGLVHYGYTYDPALLNYKTNQIYPHIYISEFVQKCFDVVGKTLGGSFFSDSLIERHVWGWGGGEPITIDSATVAERLADYTGDGTATYSLDPTIFNGLNGVTQWDYVKFILISDNAIVTMTLVDDDLSQYDQSTGIFTIANSGYYNLNIQGTFPISWAFSDLGLTGQAYFINVSFQIFKNGALISDTQHVILEATAGSTNINASINQALNCTTGDEIYSIIKINTFGTMCDDTGGFAETLDITFDLNNTLVYTLSAVDTTLVDGDTVQLSRMLPTMRAADLLRDIMTMFYLNMTDPDEDGVITMEPIDDYFYETDDYDNWTNTLDRDGDIEIEPASTIEGKVYKYRWAEDRDFYKKKYVDLFGIDYGDFNYDLPSTFKTGEKLYQLKQAQSCPVSIDGTDIVIPMIINRSDAGVDSPYKGKPRMYIYNGEIACDNWTLENSDTGALTTNAVYPQFHHLDDLTNPTFDLNFGRPTAVFYPATAYTTANLFEVYHYNSVLEMTDRGSKIVTADFKLTASDLYTNFMRRLAMIDGVLYKKNIVHDYYVGKLGLTTVELIKVLRARSKRTFGVLAPPIEFPAVGNTQTVTASTDVTSHTKSVVADTSGGDITMTFDTTKYTYLEGQSWDFVKVGGNDLILTVVGGQTISGSTSVTIRKDYDAPNIIYKQGEFYFK